MKYIEVFAVTLDGLTGGKVKVLQFFSYHEVMGLSDYRGIVGSHRYAC